MHLYLFDISFFVEIMKSSSCVFFKADNYSCELNRHSLLWNGTDSSFVLVASVILKHTTKQGRVHTRVSKWTHQQGQTCFPPLSNPNTKVTLKRQAQTRPFTRSDTGVAFVRRTAGFWNCQTYNWSGKTHYRDQKWSEHFLSRKPLHGRTPGETHQEMLEEITSRFTYHFSSGLSDGISRMPQSRAERSTCGAIIGLGTFFCLPGFKPCSTS